MHMKGTTTTAAVPSTNSTATISRVHDDDIRVLIIDLDTMFDVVSFGPVDEAVRLTANEADFIAATVRAAVDFLTVLRFSAAR